MKRIDDDYLPCNEYMVNGEKSQEGYVLFHNTKNNLYYFAVQDISGRLLFKSEGYPSPEIRETGMKSVQANFPILSNYEIIERDKKFMTILYAENHKEIARSCTFENRNEFDKAFPKLKPKVPYFTPAWLWLAMPILLFGAYLLGKKLGENIYVSNHYEQIDKYSLFERKFPKTVLYFENNTPTQNDIFTNTCYSELNTKYLDKECYYLYVNNKNRKGFKDFLAKVQYGNIALNENLTELGNFLKFNKLDSVQFSINTFANPKGETDLVHLNKRRIDLVRCSIEKVVPTKLAGKIIIKEEKILVKNSSNSPNLAINCIYDLQECSQRKVEIAGIKLYHKTLEKENPILAKSDTTKTKNKIFSFIGIL